MGKGGEGARQEEPLLMDNPERFCMFPVKYKEIWEFYKKAEASFWTGDDPHLSSDSLRQAAPLAQLCSQTSAVTPVKEALGCVDKPFLRRCVLLQLKKWI